MLIIEFPGYPKVRAILVDEPVNGVSGIIECDACDWRMVLGVSGDGEIANEIERFIKEHDCKFLARRDEVIALAERLRDGLPGHSVKLMKGKKCIREF